MQEITGKTAMMLMLADPVSHIRGSALINRAFADLGLDAVIVPLHVAPGDLRRTLETARRIGNLAGLGITIPHKIEAMHLADELTPQATRAGAVNFIRRNTDGSLTGTNTDGAGFVAGLAANGISPAGRSAFVAGAGGASRAICFALADAGVARLRISNRDHSRARSLARDIRAAMPALDVEAAEASGLVGADLVVNATSLGMSPADPAPVPIDAIEDGAVVAEVVVNPIMTALLAAAAERGCRIVPGAEMLKPQPALVARFFGLLNQHAETQR